MSLGSRLREERERARLTQDELGSRIGVSGRTVLNWENGHFPPKAKYLNELGMVGLDTGYIFSGKREDPSRPSGETFTNQPRASNAELAARPSLQARVAEPGPAPWRAWSSDPATVDSAQARGMSSIRHATQGRAAALIRAESGRALRPLLFTLPPADAGTAGRDYQLIPKHMRAAAAGSPSAVVAEPDELDLAGEMAFSFDWLRRNMDHTTGVLTTVQVRGDSMATTLLDGDTIMVDQGVQTIEVDGIYVLEVHGRRMVKRVQQLVDGTLILISDNANYQRETIPRDLARNVRVIGRMVWPRTR